MKKLLSFDKTEQMNITEQLARCEANPYLAREMFYDWFCRDTSLRAKATNLIKKLARIADSPRFDKNHHYAFFKNNCPVVGSLYDDFRICNISNGEVQFCVVPRSGFKKDAGVAQVFGKENGFESALAEGTWTEIVLWFNNPKAFESKASVIAEAIRKEEMEAEFASDNFAGAV